MSQPPAKRHKPAPRRSTRLQPRAAQPSPSDASVSASASAAGGATAAIAAAMPPSVAAVAALDAQLAPLKGQGRDELKRKRDDLEREFAERRTALENEHLQLERRIAPLQNERDEVGGYIQLVAERPSPVPAWVPADAPPTALLAAQRRLAMASLGSARLGAAATLPSDVAELVAPHIRGFDLEAERCKGRFGALAFSARAQFRQLSGMREEVVGVLITGHPLPDFNGVYRVDSEHMGWPVLKNARGCFCYRSGTVLRYTTGTVHDRVPTEKWLLNNEFTPGSGTANAFAYAREGPLPVGANTWKVRGDGKWQKHTLTVTLLP